ncbi:hypothetical protein N0V82_010393 [Gnomoniopsis sp. IMI 355080]|nr:hypothetical protein N0V82_010393 [Gnomoniopsis sp. IMI 355080]
MSQADGKHGRGEKMTYDSFISILADEAQSITPGMLPPATKPNSMQPPTIPPKVVPSPFKDYAPDTTTMLSAINLQRSAEEQLDLLDMFCISLRREMRSVLELKGLNISGAMNKTAPSLEAKVERNTQQLKNLLLATDRICKVKLRASIRTGFRVQEMRPRIERAIGVIAHLLARLKALDTEWRQRDT